MVAIKGIKLWQFSLHNQLYHNSNTEAACNTSLSLLRVLLQIACHVTHQIGCRIHLLRPSVGSIHALLRAGVLPFLLAKFCACSEVGFGCLLAFFLG
jgi:hypothetical protein